MEHVCCTCKFWLANAITQHTGMAKCRVKKRIQSYQDACPKWEVDPNVEGVNKKRKQG